MAKTRLNKGTVIMPGSVEEAARDHFEREKAAYEERTGEKCNYYFPAPLQSTPMPASAEPVEPVESADEQEVSTEGDE